MVSARVHGASDPGLSPCVMGLTTQDPYIQK